MSALFIDAALVLCRLLKLLVTFAIRWLPRSGKVQSPVPRTTKGRQALGFKLWFGASLAWITNEKEQRHVVVPGDELQILDGASSLKEDADSKINCAFFTGFAADGSCNVFLRVARRPSCKAEVWLFIHHSEIGLLQLPVYPHNNRTEGRANGFSAAGLTLKCVEPLRVWKATYNGILRLKPRNEEAERQVHAKFSLRWSAFTGVFNFDSGVHPRRLVGSSSREISNRDTWEESDWCVDETHWEQWGQLQGSLFVEDLGCHAISLRGMKARTLGCCRDPRDHYVLHYGRLETGTVFHLAVIAREDGFNTISNGYVMKPNGICEAITNCNLDLILFMDAKELPTDYIIRFETECDSYQLECHIDSVHQFLLEKEGREVEVLQRFTVFTLNGTHGRGTNELTFRNCCTTLSSSSQTELLPPSVVVTPVPSSACQSMLTLSLSDPFCCLVHLTGGKGSQLARLQTLATKRFTVPAGFCVTTCALDQHVKANDQLALALGDLQSAWQQTEHTANIGRLHQRVEECFLQSQMQSQLRETICADYVQLLPPNSLVAVRSSAVGEDSEDSSAAGQMATYLNVNGIASVLEHVLKCWASLYTYQAVQYRRQHGQPVMCGMAVVVQLMVPSGKSGVLFTADPITGNPKSILINATYGLGENVVSGQVTPDTVELEKKSDQSMCIKAVTLCSTAADSATKQTEGKAYGCLTYDEVMILANIGQEIESLFGSAVDIEWAEEGGRFYVLQARPVTTLCTETDDELLHELDTALATDKEWLTTCNIGEMMPGALTPLSQSVFAQAIEEALQNIHVSWGLLPSSATPTMKNLGVYSGCCFINLHTMSNTYENNVLISSKKVNELGLCGKVLDDLTWEMIKEHNGQASLWRRMNNGLKVIQYLWSGRHRLDELESLLLTFDLERKSSATEMYTTISESLSFYYYAWDTHMLFSAKSGMWSSTLVSVLCRNVDDLTTDMSSDMSLLLSACSGVVSADVPSALERLADIIVCENGVESCRAFVNCNPEEALNWLHSTDCSAANLCFQQFLDKHGHRCLREAEFAVKPWGADPSKLMPPLQTLVQHRIDAQSHDIHVSCGSSVQSCGNGLLDSRLSVGAVEEGIHWTETQKLENQDDEFDQIFAKLKIKLSWMKRKFIKWMLPKCREAVRQREKGKSLAVKMSDHFRQAYLHLGKLLVAEEYLPGDDLIFFLTHYEISQLLAGSNSLVTKAIRRKKLYPSQMDARYPVFNIGTPQPVSSRKAEATTGSLHMQGMPVSQGTVEGRARVVLDVKDAVNIQAGEILITQCTDVGWSPYFTLIGGLVTELGGLLSHGAVVAREYGVPCVASVTEATVAIRTGDVVRLNGSRGTLTRISGTDM